MWGRGGSHSSSGVGMGEDRRCEELEHWAGEDREREQFWEEGSMELAPAIGEALGEWFEMQSHFRQGRSWLSVFCTCCTLENWALGRLQRQDERNVGTTVLGQTKGPSSPMSSLQQWPDASQKGARSSVVGNYGTSCLLAKFVPSPRHFMVAWCLEHDGLYPHG